MPLQSLDPSYKAYLLKKNGLDPEKFDLDDNGNPSPKQVQPVPGLQPTSNDSDVSPIPGVTSNPKSSALEAAGHQALNATIPTGIGLATAGLAGLALAPFSGGSSLIPLIGMAGAGALGGAGASAIQNKFTSDEWKKQLAQEQEEHPVASFIGENVPQALAFNPIKGAANLGRAFSTGGKSVGPTFLKDLVANVGVSGGVDTAQQLMGDQPFDPIRLGESLGTAALFNSPTSIGKRLMFHSGSSVNGEPKVEQPIVQEGTVQEPEPQNFNRPSAPTIQDIVPENRIRSLGEDPLNAFIPKEQIPGIQAEGDIGKAFPKTIPKEPTTEELVNIEGLRDNPNKGLNIKSPQQIGEELATKHLASQKPEVVEPEEPYHLFSDKTSTLPSETIDPGFERVKSKTLPSDTALESMNLRYQDEPLTQEQKNNNLKLFRNATPEYRKEVAKLVAKRGISVEEAVSIIHPITGKEVLGSQDTAARKMILSENKAELDTPFHEGTHQLLEDLRTSPDPQDRRLVKEVEAGFALHNKGPNEGAAIDGGLRGANRLATSLEGTPIERARGWAKDFVSRWKFNLGIKDPEAASNYLSQRLKTDAPSFGFEGKGLPLLNNKDSQKDYYHATTDKNSLLKGIETIPSTSEFGRKGFHVYDNSEDAEWYKNMLKRKGYPNSEVVKVRIPESHIKNDNEAIGRAYYTDKFLPEYLSNNKDKYDEAIKRLKEEPDFNKKIEIQKEIEALKNENGGMPPTHEKFQEESALENKEPKKFQEESALDSKSLKGFTPALDDILKKDGPESKPIVKAFSNFFKEKPEIEGRYKVPVFKAAKTVTEERQNKVEVALNKERETGKDQEMTLPDSRERNLYRAVKDSLNGEDYPHLLNPKVLETLHENRNSDAARKYKDDFIEHQINKEGKTEEEANSLWKNIVNGRGVPSDISLPESLRREGLLRNLDKYFSKKARREAYEKNISGNKEVSDLLSPDSNFHSSRVDHVLEQIKGEPFDLEKSKVQAANRVATSAILGPLTNIHILASNLAQGLSSFQPHEVLGAVKNLVTNFHSSLENAVKNGSVKQNRKLFSDLLNVHSTGLEKMNSLAEGISRLNGRSVTDYVAKGILQNAGEHLVRLRLPMAEAGDEGAIRFMKQVDPNYEKGKTYSKDELDKLATNFGSLLHGAHDVRTMPAWMLKETTLKPFFSLASWSIGQTNNFMKNVITPAVKEHNYNPLLMSTLGSILGGYTIKELREKLSNKKSAIPSFEELANSPRGLSHNLPLAGYNLAAMASFAGYAGILSTGAKTVFDIAYKNSPQGATFPLDEVVSGSVGTLAHAASAIANANSLKEYITIGTKASSDLLRENIQSARILMSWADEKGLMGEDRQYKKNLNTEENDLRRYKMASGLPYQDQSTGGADNPYFEENRKSFKHTLDLKEATAEIPSLIQEALKSSTVDGHLNAETFKEKLTALKGSSYPSMPDPGRTPFLFYNYIRFLQKTKGPEEARNRMVEYLRNNEIGKIRSSLIPSF